jgi:diaminopimelate epimerase
VLGFAKYEGLGNDFVVVDVRASRDAAAALTRLASSICDRHRGVGADGVLLIEHPREAGSSLATMRVINADGSRPEMCGNGLRCVALHLVRTGEAAAGSTFTLDTDSGPHACHVDARERSSRVEVWMRPASLEPHDVPVTAERAVRSVIDEVFEVGDARVRLTCVSMGNPHGVTFDDVGPGARATLGPQLEKHARFPRAANIGFARMLGPQRIELAVWERGVGFTEACGTGACACAVAAVETGRAERAQPIEVRLPGGALTIRVGARAERIRMAGEARHVFDGVLEL